MCRQARLGYRGLVCIQLEMYVSKMVIIFCTSVQLENVCEGEWTAESWITLFTPGLAMQPFAQGHSLGLKGGR